MPTKHRLSSQCLRRHLSGIGLLNKVEGVGSAGVGSAGVGLDGVGLLGVAG